MMIQAVKILSIFLASVLLSCSAQTPATTPSQGRSTNDVEIPPGWELVPPEEVPPEAYEAVGIMLFEEKKYNEAHEDLETAARFGQAKAQFFLAKMLQSGLGVPKNHSEAVKWYAKAVRRGYLPAYGALATMLRNGWGTAKNTSEARRLSQIAAERGDANAQVEFGQCLLCLGKIDFLTDEDFERSENCTREPLKWYRRAAQQGDSAGQFLAANLLLGSWIDLWTRARKRAESSWTLANLTQSEREFAERNAQFASIAKNLWVDRQIAPMQPMLRSIQIEKYKWAILALKQGEERATKEYGFILEKIKSNDFRGYEEIEEAFRLASEFVPRKESTNEWLTTTGTANGSSDPISSGSGFFVSEDGYLLTNFHVVEDAMRIALECGKNKYSARLVKADPVNDLALLKATGKFRPLPIAPSHTVKLGDSVFTVGFPNPKLQGLAPKLTDGKINSLSGLRDDARHFQISVAVQPGSSGGALINATGNVVGIITARLSEMAALETTGVLPQNVNYAIKSSYVISLLQSLPTSTTKLRDLYPARDRKFDDIVREATDAAALVLAY